MMLRRWRNEAISPKNPEISEVAGMTHTEPPPEQQAAVLRRALTESGSRIEMIELELAYLAEADAGNSTEESESTQWERQRLFDEVEAEVERLAYTRRQLAAMEAPEEEQLRRSEELRQRLNVLRKAISVGSHFRTFDTKEGLPSTASGGEGPKGDRGQIPDEISVIVYLDTDSDATIARVIKSVDRLVEVLGYYGPTRLSMERGSFFRQSWARLKRFFTSEEARELAIKTERALEIRYLDREQAQVDNSIADALSKIIGSLADVPSACIRAGSILLIKYPGPDGVVLLTRNLSQLEIRTLEQFPEIQRVPQTALESLALAISEMREAEPQ
jgi:hypothetical protein